jgi:hypothetical protein
MADCRAARRANPADFIIGPGILPVVGQSFHPKSKEKRATMRRADQKRRMST